MVRLPRKGKQTYRLNSRPPMSPLSLILAMTLALNFQGQILLYLSQKLSDCNETKSRHIDWTLGLKCHHWVWPWPWHWRIDWILGLKCHHWVWSWPWHWPLIFRVKYGLCNISAKNGPIATKRKVNISMELYASNVTNGIELDHALDLVFSRSNNEFVGIRWD